ncbi:helix-turn-helix domain-containing protein [Streptomyces lateritius]|uniref:helix-turn-helix domain-containing protein n=1 Tax=Streptomyces lateritius TaxID=67313 RepID=UPI0019B42333|nr:DNA-binding protein [Streptomyces lateritius]
MRHTTRYTVVGNHLAQHEKLSLMAIGLAVHIQSLPDGACIAIKALAARFPEGEICVAAALRELEEHGYLARKKERLPNGRLATRTVSYNRPSHLPQEPELKPEPERKREPDPAPEPRPVARPAPEAPPAPSGPAASLLAGLHLHEPRLLLSERDVHRLAPGVAAWLDRGAHPDAVCRTLTASLPDNLKHPAGLLAHRLTALLPPPLPARPPTPDPLQNCDRCDRAFRGPEPGACPGCRRAHDPCAA